MAIRKCPACHFERSHHFMNLKKDHLLKCDSCGLVFSEFENQDFEKMYSSSYFSGSESNLGYSDYEGERESHELEFETRVNSILRKTVEVSSILDVGCASGHFLNVASKHFRNVFGADISIDALDVAVKRKGYHHQVLQCDLEKLCFKKESFDVITAFDVLEHLNDPHDAVDSIWKSLKTGGMVHITVPNHSSMSRILMRRFWYHYKPFEHLSYFNQRSLKHLLLTAGFVKIKIQSYRTKFKIDHLIERTKFYSNLLYRLLSFIVRKLQIGDITLSVPSGEIEAFAFKPGVRAVQIENEPEEISLISLVSCPSCKGDLAESSSRWKCKSCRSSYELQNGVPRLIEMKAESKEKRKRA